MNFTDLTVLALFVVLALAFFLLFRQRGKINLKGPLGTRIKLEGSNDPVAPTPGLKARDVRAETGSVIAKDKTGSGVDAEKVTGHKNVTLTNEAPQRSPDPNS